VRQANPGLKIGEQVKLCSAIWSALTPEEKAVYEEAAAADKLRMQKELAEAGIKKLPAVRYAYVLEFTSHMSCNACRYTAVAAQFTVSHSQHSHWS
jgi:HMG (high mobility group) box